MQAYGWPLDVCYYEYPVSSLMNGLASYWPMKEEGGDRLDSLGRNSFQLSGGTIDRIAGLFANSYATKIRQTNSPRLTTVSNPYNVRLGDRTHTWALWLKFTSRINVGSGQYVLYIQDDYNLITVCTRLQYALQVGEAEASINTGAGSVLQDIWYLVWAWNHREAQTIGIQLQESSVVDNDYGVDLVRTGILRNLQLGYLSAGNGQLDCDVGPIALWHRLLTQAEKDLYYNNGNGLVPNFLGVQC